MSKKNGSGAEIDPSLSFDKVDIYGPWRPNSRTTVLLLCQGATHKSVRTTLVSLFKSYVQNFEIICIDVTSSGLTELKSWTQHDPRVSFTAELPEVLPEAGAILIIRAGWIVTQFSLLALWEALTLPNVQVLRSVTEGVPGTMEFWNAEWLAGQGPRVAAEGMARSLGVERWISAEGLGMHAIDLPAPRVFFRRGAADKHLIDVVAYDAGSKSYLVQKESEILDLKREIRELNQVMTSHGKRQPTVFKKAFRRIRRHMGRSL